jgi:radical SAM superfamily enzyme YgiQ (UPF0313 family)
MRVLLLAPTALDLAGRPVKQRRIYMPGLTLYLLAAFTPSNVQLRLVNETAEEIPYGEPWDLVGLTGMGSGLVRAWQIADRFRQLGRKAVIGGIAASLTREELRLAHADSLVIGQAERLWPQVVRDAQAGCLQAVYKDENSSNTRPLPLPRYDLMNGGVYGRWTPVQATRGCPHACRFCSVTAFFGHSYYRRPVKEVIRDVREVKRCRSRYITLIDDNIGADWDYCAALWQALIPERILWMSQCSLRIADRPDLLRLARRSGCRILSVGIESLNRESLDDVDKAWNRPEGYGEAIRAIRAHGIELSTEMMLGLDEDDSSVFDRTYDFLMQHRIPLPRIHIVTPIPGTPLFEEMEREGRILTDDFGRYNGGDVVFQPRNSDPETLKADYWKLYRRLFTWPAIWHRLQRNEARLEPYFRVLTVGVNLHYRDHIRRQIVPGIV